MERRRARVGRQLAKSQGGALARRAFLGAEVVPRAVALGELAPPSVEARQRRRRVDVPIIVPWHRPALAVADHAAKIAPPHADGAAEIEYLEEEAVAVEDRRRRRSRRLARGRAVDERDEARAMRRQRLGRRLLQVRERGLDGPGAALRRAGIDGSLGISQISVNRSIF